MRAKSIPPNPILEHIRKILASGKMTKEKICVMCDLKYPTFDNIFSRPVVSLMVRKDLLRTNIITKQLWEQYNVWHEKIYTPWRRRNSEANAPRSKDKIRGRSKRAKNTGTHASAN